jgi:hypothetical protein
VEMSKTQISRAGEAKRRELNPRSLPCMHTLPTGVLDISKQSYGEISKD